MAALSYTQPCTADMTGAAAPARTLDAAARIVKVNFLADLALAGGNAR